MPDDLKLIFKDLKVHVSAIVNVDAIRCYQTYNSGDDLHERNSPLPPHS